jgi:hypothetical protein
LGTALVGPRQKIAWLSLVLAKSLSVEAAARRYGCAPQCQSTFHQRQRDATSSGNRQIQLLRPRRRTRRAPTDRAARFIDDRSHSVSGRFSISTTRGQHHVPSSTLDASCVTRKKAKLEKPANHYNSPASHPGFRPA